MYVVIRTDQGRGYLAKPGSRGSYTFRLEEARVFTDEASARAECCPGNEIPVRMEDCLGGL